MPKRRRPLSLETQRAKKRLVNEARRANPDCRNQEQQADTRRRRVVRQIDRDQITWEDVVVRYEDRIRDGPIHKCFSCDRLFFKNQVTGTTKQKLLKRGCTPEYIEVLVLRELLNHETYYFCATCRSHITKKTFSKFNIQHSAIAFPEIPATVKELQPLELRCVALRHPFMQIKALGCGRQYGIASGVVNVPVNLQVTVGSIPLHPSDTNVIELQWMRRMSYKRYYHKGRIRPNKVLAAAKDLLGTPLYAGINIDINWPNDGKFGLFI